MPKRISGLFTWLNEWLPEECRGELLDIFIAPSAGQPMQRVNECECLSGLGLRGDRYALGEGHWIKTDGCEVTLITAADLARANRKSPVSMTDGQHRRNLVVSRIPQAAYRRRKVRIGGVLFEFHRLRPPCGYLDRLVRPGVAKALGRGAGIGLRVIGEGVIRVGDSVEVLQYDVAGRRLGGAR